MSWPSAYRRGRRSGVDVPATAGWAGAVPPAWDEIDRWVDEGRVAEAADARSRRHWLRRQLDAETTLRGVLLDLAERGDPVTVTTPAGPGPAGRLRIVGLDFVLVATTAADVLVP